MSNPLDHKPFRNIISGKGVKKRQRFKPNPLSGFGKGTDVTAPKNKLAYPPGRHRLVFRAMLDGVKLIESLKGEVGGMVVRPSTSSKLTVMPPVGFAESQRIRVGDKVVGIMGINGGYGGVVTRVYNDERGKPCVVYKGEDGRERDTFLFNVKRAEVTESKFGGY